LSLSGCYSCESYMEMKGEGPVAPEVANKFYWDKDCKPIVESEPVAKPATEPAAKPVERKVSSEATECGVSEAMNSYPCDSCGIIKIDKSLPSTVQLNDSFDYEINVKNLTSGEVGQVVVTEHMGDNFQFDGSSPQATADGGRLQWQLGTFEPQEVKTITVSGSAASTDCIKNCTTVEYVVPVCAYVQVVEPQLKLTKEAPEKVTICDDIPLTFTVTNSGTGEAANVVITDTLPDGLVTLDGKEDIEINVGSLMPGQSQLFTVNTKAQSTGVYENRAYAQGGGGLEAQSAMTTTTVTQPVLEITKEGPEMRYLGRAAEYTITVSNTGDEVAQNTVLEDTIPSGVSDVSVSDGGSVTGNMATWQLGNLAPDTSKTVTISYTPDDIGEVSNRASVTAVCADGVAASATTDVEGIAAVLLEVIDLEDPIEIGSNVTYNILVTNQGTSDATNVDINAFLEDTMEYVSSSGATSAELEGNRVNFSPLPSLAPQEVASWNVTVTAVAEGDVRFTVSMNCDQLDRDVDETESTHFYE
jgi:uncharacterized repeat protein (TIGR01451 family)